MNKAQNSIFETHKETANYTNAHSVTVEPLVIRQPQSIALNVDCMDYMREIPDKFFALAIVDPPYGIQQGGEKNYTRSCLATSKNYHSFNDDNIPDEKYFDELRRVSRNQIIWGCQYFGLPRTSCVIVWDKDNGENDFADCEVAWTSFKTAARLFKYKWQGMLQENMKQKEIRIHPTQKPIALYDWLLRNYAEEGWNILDTHLGSGSSRIACHKAGLDFVGCEIDKDYYNAQEKRFADYLKQLPMQFAAVQRLR